MRDAGKYMDGLLENFNTEHLLSPKHESFYAKTAFE